MRRAIARAALVVISLVIFAHSASAEIPAALLIENRAKGVSLRLERDTLEQWPHVAELVTSTPWQSRPSRFTGLPLDHVLDLARIEASDRLSLTALNDYSIELPRE